MHAGRKRRQNRPYHRLPRKSKVFWQNTAPKHCQAGEKLGFPGMGALIRAPITFGAPGLTMF
jgi:hypothetical protein